MDGVLRLLKITISLRSDKDLPTALNSILIEDVDREFVTLDPDKGQIRIETDSFAKGRAIMNSYIYWLYTILTTFEELGENVGRKGTA